MKLLSITGLFLVSALLSSKQNIDYPFYKPTTIVEWLPGELVHLKNNLVTIKGDPKVVACKYGNALQFNGKTDGLFLDQMPLASLTQFTVEVLFCPSAGGKFEQRLLHMGEIRENRVLLEIRSSATDWYFDAFIKSGDQKKTLIDSSLLHPLNQWYHLAYVNDNGKLITYINGNKELESQIIMTPIQTGKTSIGVRQSEQSWFNGMIYKIRITPKALKPSHFLQY